MGRDTKGKRVTDQRALTVCVVHDRMIGRGQLKTLVVMRGHNKWGQPGTTWQNYWTGALRRFLLASPQPLNPFHGHRTCISVRNKQERVVRGTSFCFSPFPWWLSNSAMFQDVSTFCVPVGHLAWPRWHHLVEGCRTQDTVRNWTCITWGAGPLIRRFVFKLGQ